MQYNAVIGPDGAPLTPTTNTSKLWYLVRKSRARLVRRLPVMTFQLLYTPENDVRRPVTLGVDPGREHIGLAAVMPLKDDRTVVVTTVQVETGNKQISGRMEQRAFARHARRRYEREKRKRRARSSGTLMHEQEIERKYPGYTNGTMRVKEIRNTEPRFLNRKRGEGWLTPTVTHLVRVFDSSIKGFAKILPIENLCLEMPRFAFMRLENGLVYGTDFQNGRMRGFANVNEYVRERDKHCVVCGKTIEHIHHLVPRSRGGSNLPENLVGLCAFCHQKIHEGKISAEKLGQGLQKKYHHASVVNSAVPSFLTNCWKLFGSEHVTCVSGLDTIRERFTLGLPKSSCHDAITIACIGQNWQEKPINISDELILAMRFRRHTKRQRSKNAHERIYKFNNKIIAKNRGPRNDTKSPVPSLREWAEKQRDDIGDIETENMISRLTVSKWTRTYLDAKRESPGMMFKFEGKEFVMTANHGKIYYYACGEGKRDFPRSKITFLCHNRGLAYVRVQ